MAHTRLNLIERRNEITRVYIFIILFVVITQVLLYIVSEFTLLGIPADILSRISIFDLVLLLISTRPILNQWKCLVDPIRTVLHVLCNT